MTGSGKIFLFSCLGLVAVAAVCACCLPFSALLDLTSSEEERDKWPMFRHDLTHSGYSTSKAPDSGDLLWVFEAGAEIWPSPVVAYKKVFFGSFNGKVYALDEFSGEEIWSYQTGGRVFSTPAVMDGKVFVGSEDSYFYALDAETGELKWRVKTIGQVRPSPAIAEGMVFFGAGYRDGGQTRFYALDQATGDQVWSKDTTSINEEEIASSPAVVNDRIIFGTFHNPKHVCALDLETGNTVWLGGDPPHFYDNNTHSSPAVADGKVYIGSGDWSPGPQPDDYRNSIVALDESDGSLLWEYHTGFTVPSSPAIVNGTVFVGSYDTYVYALDADRGTLKWRFKTNGWVFSSPTVADGKVFFGLDDGNLYALNERSGDLLWSYPTGDKVRSSPAVADGLVFVGSFGGKLYAFGTPRSR